MFMLQCSEVETKPNTNFLFLHWRITDCTQHSHQTLGAKQCRGVVVTKLTRLSQKIVILCPGWQKAIQLAIQSPNDEFRHFWLCLCKCAAPTTVSQPVPSLFKRELDAL